MLPILRRVRQYIFMVTDRHHLTGLNHKISSLPGQAELHPSQLALSPAPSSISLLCHPLSGLWLVSSQPMRGSHRVTWPGPRPPLWPRIPPLSSGLIQFAHIHVRGLIKYSDVISKVARIRTHSHHKTLHTITSSYLDLIFLNTISC